MTTTDLPTTAPQVDQRLRQAWQRECGYVHLRGLCHLLLWLLGLIVFDLLVDWLLELPGIGRLFLLALNIGVLAYIGYQHWWRHLRAYDPARVALQVERLHPGLCSLLVSYVQLNGDEKRPVHGSRRLIEAMKEQARAALPPLDFSGIVDFTTLKKLGGVTAVVLLLFAASTLFAGEFYRVLFARLFNPASTLAYPTRTRIDDVTGDFAVRQGDPIRLEAKASGEIPAQGYLYLKQGESRWERVTLTRGEDAAFVHLLPKANQTLTYYFKIGDARSTTHQATVVPPPHIVEARTLLRFPTYTRRSPESLESLNLPAIPEGTEARWELRCDQELEEGRMIFLRDGAAPVEMEIDENDRRTARLTLRDVSSPPGQPSLLRSRKEAETLSYQFEWKERSHGYTFRDSTRYSIEVIPDRTPQVTIVRPRLSPEQEKLLATTLKNLAITFEVSDDYGLSAGAITFRLNDDPEPRRRSIGEFRDKDGKKHPQSGTFLDIWKLRDTIPDLKEGDVLTFTVEATDNRASRDAPNPNRGQSSPVRLHIVSEEEYRRFAQKEKERGDERIKTAVRDEEEGSKKIKTLIPIEEKNP